MAKVGMSGGANMVKVLAELVEKLGPERVVKVGFMEGTMAGYNGPRPLHGRPETAASESAQGSQVEAAQVAFWQEYGTKKIPPRPFFRNMIEGNSKTWGRLVQAALRASKNDSTKALAITGMRIGAQLQKSIIDLKGPKLADSTVKRKGFPDPLIDSHNMLRAVEFEVVGGDRSKINEGA